MLLLARGFYLAGMNGRYVYRLAASIGSLAFLLGCEASPHLTNVVQPLGTSLVGNWTCDSTSLCDYSPRHEVLSRWSGPFPAPLLLTVGPTQWHYSGYSREEHAYTRRGDTLFINRLGDTHLVDLHYIRPEQVGKVIGHPDTLFIELLTAQQLILRDSTHAPDGFSRVGVTYHSR